MINWETIKSLYNDKPTLLQWLKKVEAALAASVLQVVDVEKVSVSEIKLNFVFEDGTNIETPTIALPYEIQNVAIVNGHLILTLESGETLDAGNLGAVSGFSIDAAQHLIVTYQDGRTQDLGAIFEGNVNVNGNFTANSIIENMVGFGVTDKNASISFDYIGVCKNGNKITFVNSGTLNISSHPASGYVIALKYTIPSSVGEKLIPLNDGTSLGYMKMEMFSNYDTSVSVPAIMIKQSDTEIYLRIYDASLSLNTDYYYRYEITFLLGENLAQ